MNFESQFGWDFLVSEGQTLAILYFGGPNKFEIVNCGSNLRLSRSCCSLGFNAANFLQRQPLESRPGLRRFQCIVFLVDTITSASYSFGLAAQWMVTGCASERTSYLGEVRWAARQVLNLLFHRLFQQGSNHEQNFTFLAIILVLGPQFMVSTEGLLRLQHLCRLLYCVFGQTRWEIRLTGLFVVSIRTYCCLLLN